MSFQRSYIYPWRADIELCVKSCDNKSWRVTFAFPNANIHLLSSCFLCCFCFGCLQRSSDALFKLTSLRNGDNVFRLPCCLYQLRSDAKRLVETFLPSLKPVSKRDGTFTRGAKYTGLNYNLAPCLQDLWYFSFWSQKTEMYLEFYILFRGSMYEC